MRTIPGELTLLSVILVASLVSVRAGPRTSANYSVATDVADAGGNRMSSASYTNDGSVGGPAGLANVASPAEVAKSGYIGQLYEITGLTLTAASLNVNENTTDQLSASQLLDDTSLLAVPAAQVAWSVQSGPLTGINTSGLATAATVYQDTAATAQGIYLGLTGSLMLTVKNVNLDDFGAYAGDQIDDGWQVQYFGQPPNPNAGPNVDFDGTGQTNLFKYLAGLNPLDDSRFGMAITTVPAQSGQKTLSFTPVVGGRIYTVKAASSLGGTYSPINGSPPIDTGSTRTITDMSAGSGPRFYHVEITLP